MPKTQSNDSGGDGLNWRTTTKVPSSLPFPDMFLNAVAVGSVVLDIGCGEAGAGGAVTRKGGCYVGLDPNLPSLARAVGRHAVVQGEGKALPFRNGSFDLVLLRAVLTVIPERERLHAVLREGFRVCRGMMAIQDFLQTWSIPLYADRYREGQDLGLEDGVFPVVQDGRLLYRARHFTVDLLRELILEAGGHIVSVFESQWPTRSGNVINGVALLASPSGYRAIY